MQRFDREPLAGFANPSVWITGSGLEILTVSGAVNVLDYRHVRAVYFVRDFPNGDLIIGRREFASRPRIEGVWIRLVFRDGDATEAVMPNDLLQVEPAGLYAILPEGGLRAFVPRAALSVVQVLGVVGKPVRPPRKQTPKEQIGLFDS